MMRQTTKISITNQHGAVLIVALLLLTLMGIVTFSTYNGTIIEERMAGNANNRSIVFQAAESVLRSVERSIDNNIDNINSACTPGASGVTEGWVDYNKNEPPPPPGASPERDALWANKEDKIPGEASSLTGWKTPAGVSSARFVIEYLDTKEIGNPVPMSTPVYRITARVTGYGGTVVVLESTYACN